MFSVRCPAVFCRVRCFLLVVVHDQDDHVMLSISWPPRCGRARRSKAFHLIRCTSLLSVLFRDCKPQRQGFPALPRCSFVPLCMLLDLSTGALAISFLVRIC
ncbi:hypothetical protein PENSPDRAFT_329476 [Peniophora sp. CONT]|nr:hypothetical protein PENSPDRAFT_329476 [Peniophora sp. CONT]